FIQKKHEEEQAANAQYLKIPACCDDNEDYNVAITPNEPVDSLSMGDEHLNTILAMESNEFIKSCVENLVPNPSEPEDGNGYDMPACFTTFSNVLFNTDYDFYSIDQHHFNAESDLIESLLNHDSSIIPSSSKIYSLLDEFADELTLLKSISSGIDETDCDPEGDIHIIERLLYDNSSPSPGINQADCDPEEDIRIIERLLYDNSSPSPGINQADCDPEEDIRIIERLLYDNSSPRPPKEFDSDSFMEEIDLSFNPDDPMPPGIEDDDDDSERDILILEELLENYSLSFPVIESYHFDIPSFHHPPAKPPDGNTGILNIKIMGDNSEQKVPIPGLTITRVSNQEKSPDLLSHRSLENF
nr:hypothetical protein [Tanacetum cinerariifolium]